MHASDTDKPLIVLGSGAYSYTMVDVFLAWPGWPGKVGGFAQNLDGSRRGERFENYPVYTLDELPALAPTHRAMCVLGDGRAKRRFVGQAEALDFEFARWIHPQTFVSPTTTLGPGFISGIATVITGHNRIGRHCTFCSHTQVGENGSMGDCVYVGPGVKIAGSVNIGSEVFIGISAAISDHVTIGDGATIGAGAVVIRDVPPGATVVGNPARVIEPHRGCRSGGGI